jgi:hypothetical protein
MKALFSNEKKQLTKLVGTEGKRKKIRWKDLKDSTKLLKASTSK